MKNESELEKLMGVAARSASTRQTFLGWVLTEYQNAEGLDDEALAQYLQIMPKTLPSLRLCLRPRGTLFLQDVEAITDAVQCNADVLVSVIRHVEFLTAARRGTGVTNAGHLLAARSRSAKRRRGKGGLS